MERQNPDHNRQDPQRNDVRQQPRVQRYRIVIRIQQVDLNGNDQLEQAADERMLDAAEGLMRLRNIFSEGMNGLTPGRIEKFEHFDADESLVGEQCIVCLKDLDVGMQMVRLDCHVSHYLCKTCTDEWFKDHKTCPTCNHIFN